MADDDDELSLRVRNNLKKYLFLTKPPCYINLFMKYQLLLFANTFKQKKQRIKLLKTVAKIKEDKLICVTRCYSKNCKQSYLSRLFWHRIRCTINTVHYEKPSICYQGHTSGKFHLLVSDSELKRALPTIL